MPIPHHTSFETRATSRIGGWLARAVSAGRRVVGRALGLERPVADGSVSPVLRAWLAAEARRRLQVFLRFAPTARTVAVWMLRMRAAGVDPVQLFADHLAARPELCRLPARRPMRGRGRGHRRDGGFTRLWRRAGHARLVARSLLVGGWPALCAAGAAHGRVARRVIGEAPGALLGLTPTHAQGPPRLGALAGS